MFKALLHQRILRRLVKSAGLPQYNPVPLSPLTAVSDFIANKKYVPERNPLTSKEHATLQRLLAGMSRSRARVVDASRRGRKEVLT